MLFAKLLASLRKRQLARDYKTAAEEAADVALFRERLNWYQSQYGRPNEMLWQTIARQSSTRD